MLKKHMKNWRSFLSIFILGSVIAGAASVLGACKSKPEEVTLPFDTIEQKEWAGTGQFYESREPGLIVVSRPEEVENLGGIITEEAKAKLQALDYSNYFVLLILQGWKPTTGYKPNIDRITRLENTVNIYAQFQEPKPDEKKADAVTSPYQLVQVQKGGSWGQGVTFNLIVDEASVVSLSHAIP